MQKLESMPAEILLEIINHLAETLPPPETPVHPSGPGYKSDKVHSFDPQVQTLEFPAKKLDGTPASQTHPGGAS